jgi:hypothetical protein
MREWTGQQYYLVPAMCTDERKPKPPADFQPGAAQTENDARFALRSFLAFFLAPRSAS